MGNETEGIAARPARHQLKRLMVLGNEGRSGRRGRTFTGMIKFMTIIRRPVDCV